VEDNGVEPMTSCMPFRGHRVPSENLSGVTATEDSRCTTCCPAAPENERGEAGEESVSKKSKSPPIKGDSFSAALLMIASLPLSDAEKADAVRRLMADQAVGPVCGP